MKKYIKLFIFAMIIILSPNAYALDYNVSSIVSSPVGGANTGKYAGTELNGGRGAFSIGTRYNGTLTRIEYNLPVPSAIDDDCWPTNMTYTITMNMATEDWRNRFGAVSVNDSLGHEFSNGNVSYISMKKIKFTFKIPSSDTSCHNYVYVNLPSRELFTPFTGETNWNLSSIIVSDTLSNGSSGGSSGGSSTPTPSPGATNQDIINNQTQNTQDIIDNSSQNTSDIIENNNNNTQQIIDNNNENMTCPVGPLQVSYDDFKETKGRFLSDGSIGISGEQYISPYFIVKPNTQYNLIYSDGSYSGSYFCFYTNNKTLISCLRHNSDNSTFTTDNNTVYIRFSLNPTKPFAIKGPVCNDWQKEAMEKLKDVNQSIYDTLTDDSNPNIQDNEFTSLFDSVSITNPLDSLLQLPVQFINAIVNQSNSCQVVNLGTLLGVSISLPCIDIGSILGSTVWNTIDVLSSIGLVVLILKQLYESITNALTLGGYMDAKRYGLGYMPPLEFLCSILTGWEVDI